MTRVGKYLFSAFLLLAFVGCGGDSANNASNKPSTSHDSSTSHANTSNTSNTNNTSNSDNTSDNTSTSNNTSQTKPLILANAGDDVAVQVNTRVSLEASGNYDGYENITYEWFENDKLLSNEQSFTKSDFSVGVHEITLKVYGDTISRANKNQIAQDTKKVIISRDKPTNLPPKAITDAFIQVVEGKSVTFNASNSTDEDVSSLSYAWYENEKLLSNDVSFTKNDFSLGMHYVKLVVTDSSGLSSKKVVWVKVGADITKDEPIVKKLLGEIGLSFNDKIGFCGISVVFCNYYDGYDLKLYNNSQNLTLPSIIGELKYVNNIFLTGFVTLPDEFTNLTQLHSISLGGGEQNKSYDFPPQLLKLPNLTNIQLEHMPINSIPSDIKNLQKLHSLSINLLNFSGSEIAKLKDLKNLDHLELLNGITQSPMTHLPDEIALLKNLKTLRFNTNGSNILNDIELLSQLPKLTTIHLSLSAPTDLPNNINKLSNLEDLTIIAYVSKLNLPPQINELSNLKRIIINTTMDVLPALNNLKKLEELQIIDKNLTTFPQDISELTSLTNIYFGEGKFETLPKGINKLQNLTKLVLFRTSLSTLPPEIGELSKLYELSLQYNKQLVALPSEIGNLDHLHSLYLYDNNITSLPPEIGNLKNLRELDLGNNNLKTLPKQITKLKNLGYLEFRLNGNNNLCVNDPEIVEFLKSKGVSESEYSHCE